MDTDDVLRLGKGSIGPDLSPIKESPLREALQQEAAPLKWQIPIVLSAQLKMHGTVTAIYGMKKDTPLVEFYRFKPDSTAIAKTGAHNVSLSVTFDPENWLAQTLQVFSQRGSPRHDSQACTVSWRTLASDSVHSS